MHDLLTSISMKSKRNKPSESPVTVDIVLRSVTPPHEEPQAGLLGASPEGIVTTGDDRSLQVIAPEGMPVGHGVEVEDHV